MGIFSCCKPKKVVVYDTEALKNKIDELTAIVEHQNEFIRTRDNDIKKLKEALKERDHIFGGVRWALSLQTTEPWSAKPALSSNPFKGSGHAKAHPKPQSSDIENKIVPNQKNQKGKRKMKKPEPRAITEPSNPNFPSEGEPNMNNSQNFCLKNLYNQ